MANGDESGNAEPASTKYLGTRIVLGVLVVALGLGAVVWSLSLVLDNYDVKAAEPAPGNTVAGTTAIASNDGASVSASSVVAVLTPVMAGILGIVGLYFGISATGSARGRQAEAEQKLAEAHAANADANRLHAAATHERAKKP